MAHLWLALSRPSDTSRRVRRSLDGNRLGDEGASCIAEELGLNDQSCLQGLNLMYNGITDDGAAHLAEMMLVNTRVQLGLKGNSITAAARDKFAEAETET